MKVRIFSALCGVSGFLIIGIAGFLSGCASGHKQFAYVVGQGTNEVFEFQVHNSGALAPLGTPNFAVGSNPSAVTAHTSGDFLYIADFAGNDVTLLDINAGNGNLSVPVSTSIVVPVNPPNVFATGAGPIALAMSPTTPFLYAADQTSGDITAFTVDPGTGSLGAVAGSPFLITPASNPQSLAISPQGNLLFTANPTQGTVAAFVINSNGALAAVAGSPFSTGVGSTPNSIAVEHSGRFLYVADTAHNAVLGFAIQSNGTLTPISGSPFGTGAAPSGIGIDPQGALLFVANAGSNDVSAYAIDSSSGALGAISGSPFATGGVGPSAVAVDANTSIVYVTDEVSHDVAAFGIASNGVLKPVTGSPFGVATSASSISVVLR
ncbi:MAG TPA: beta-propeller fold lactonase family protein [Candidatus Angelobacter sp.]